MPVPTFLLWHNLLLVFVTAIENQIKDYSFKKEWENFKFEKKEKENTHPKSSSTKLFLKTFSER